MNIVLWLGDCLVRMQGIDENSIEAAVFDPPYEISFMSKSWDGRGIAFSPVMWGEVLRCLRPGGTVKAFCGTRTYHRMALAMERAGFVISNEQGLEAWTYGCLSADSEILTESGWKPGPEAQVGERVACWDSVTSAISLEPVQETFRGPFTGDLVSFKNDNTDQALTPNHRVYKKHRIRKMVSGTRHTSEDAAWNVSEASKIDRWNHLRLPLAGFHDGPGIGGTDLAGLLGWVWSEGGFDDTGTGVRITQSSVNQPFVDAIDELVRRMIPTHKHYTREREHESRDPKRGRYTYTEHTWFFSGEPALQMRRLLPEKHPTWNLVWQMTQEEKKAFMWAAIRGDGSLKSGKVLVDGSRGRENYAFYQQHEPDLVLFQALCHLTGRQGRVNLGKSLVGVHDNPMTQLQNRHLKASVVVPYNGDVWCVRVPTGAFVARRNGLVFITGNSGFPKSLNVAKAIDRQLGAVREKKRMPYSGNALLRHGGDNTRPWMEAALENGYHELPGDEPASPEAKAWEGWGTALKPAWEPVIVGTKP